MKIIRPVFIILSCLMFLHAEKAVEPIEFKADRVEYVYKKGKEKVTCKGNALVERSDFNMKADLIHILGANKDYVKAYDNIKMDPDSDRIIKCDLCDGDPECVKYCAYDTLTLLEASDETLSRKESERDRIANLLAA